MKKSPTSMLSFCLRVAPNVMVKVKVKKMEMSGREEDDNLNPKYNKWYEFNRIVFNAL